MALLNTTNDPENSVRIKVNLVNLLVNIMRKEFFFKPRNIVIQI